MRRRIETQLTDRDKAAIGYALVEAATTGARVAYASLAANAAELGLELPESFSVEGLRSQNLWAPEN
jgi:hypothetical protein